MALPSQGGNSNRGGMYRRHRVRRSATWFIVILIAAVGTWILWPDGNWSDSTNSTSENPQVVEESPDKTVVALEEPNPTIPETTPLQPLSVVVGTPPNFNEGLQSLDQGKLNKARMQLSATLQSGGLTDTEESQLRGVLTDISDLLVFSPEMTSDDPYAIEYIIQGGDTLSGIVNKMGLQVDWRFIQRINGISHASSIRPGQSLKLISGPFHAIVDKESYRIDLFLGDGDEQVFVRSYRVGLGEFNSTPTGLFKVRQHSKLVNPTWVNPRTRAFYSADNPENPIGERWIGLQGAEERTYDLEGLGIHGTIEPETIGTQSSMGCIRMHAEDVAQVYEMLSEGVSTIEIR
ncbi:MAG: L,D-transpeptidase family protein [Phycisphaerales bacterium]|jgi:lipoprotein-anchoring transpeptidase ErfK/SrfK|nr:L,D-transpeptidase family protein [Phycisphaerales bacterium]